MAAPGARPRVVAARPPPPLRRGPAAPGAAAGRELRGGDRGAVRSHALRDLLRAVHAELSWSGSARRPPRLGAGGHRPGGDRSARPGGRAVGTPPCCARDEARADELRVPTRGGRRVRGSSRAGCLRAGGKILVGRTVTGLGSSGDRVTAVRAGAERFPCDGVVWTGPIGEALRLVGVERDIPPVPLDHPGERGGPGRAARVRTSGPISGAATRSCGSRRRRRSRRLRLRGASAGFAPR